MFARTTFGPNRCLCACRPRSSDLSDRAKAYGFPGVSVDGNDVLAVYDAATKAIARAREGEGPTFIECKTYRWYGHSEIDPAKYRTQG